MDISPEFITRAVEDVAMERARQKLVEGWTPEHDDEHTHDELRSAAVAYATPFRQRRYFAGIPEIWPWHPSWWKPKDERRDLVRAAALLLAEIERLDRASSLNGDGSRE